MRKDQVPQDDANMFQGKTRELQYAIDENGNYTTIKSVGWDPKNEVMQHAWDDVKDQIMEAKRLVETGKKSPLYYHMVKQMMDPKILGKYTGIWSWTVKRHMTPKAFEKLSDEILEKYRMALNLNSIKELKETE